MDLKTIQKNLKTEYSYTFSFSSLREIKNPRSDSLFRVKTRYYYGTKALTKRKLKDHEHPDLAKRGVHIIEYRDPFLRSVIALRMDVPTFDSGDRQYDSRHTLYIFHSWTDISAVYCKEGYTISELYILENLTAVSVELLEILKTARFPVSRVKHL